MVLFSIRGKDNLWIIETWRCLRSSGIPGYEILKFPGLYIYCAMKFKFMFRDPIYHSKQYLFSARISSPRIFIKTAVFLVRLNSIAIIPVRIENAQKAVLKRKLTLHMFPNSHFIPFCKQSKTKESSC